MGALWRKAEYLEWQLECVALLCGTGKGWVQNSSTVGCTACRSPLLTCGAKLGSSCQPLPRRWDL